MSTILVSGGGGGGGGGGGSNTAKVYASYSVMGADPDNTIAQTTDDGMLWIRQEGTWRPARSRIFNNLNAKLDVNSENIKPFPVILIKETLDNLSGKMFLDNSILDVLDP